MKKNYKSQYLDPRWQRKRLEILERDSYRCQGCGGEDKTLHVHHRYYVNGRDVWDYPNFTLVTLCEECHESPTESDDSRVQINGRDWYYWEHEMEWERDPLDGSYPLFELIGAIRSDGHDKLGAQRAVDILEDVSLVLFKRPDAILKIQELASDLRKKGAKK